MKDKIVEMLSDLPSIEEDLGNPEVMNDKKRYRELTSQHKYLTKLKDSWDSLTELTRQLVDNKGLLKSEKDPDFIDVLEEEIAELEKTTEDLSKRVETLLVPPDPNDHRNSIIELRAGTGGDEAALFVGDCVRMYKYFAEKNGWGIELLSSTDSEKGGFKEYQMVFSGENVFRLMKYEAGTHRVQRVAGDRGTGACAYICYHGCCYHGAGRRRRD